jgi:hypothetical protein
MSWEAGGESCGRGALDFSLNDHGVNDSVTDFQTRTWLDTEKRALVNLFER